MKKFLMFMLLSVLMVPIEAQDNQRTPTERTTVVQYLTRDRLMTWISTGPPPKGSVYLHENWNNIGILEMNDGTLAKTRNINYNVDAQRFESTFAKDSVFALNSDELNAVTLNNRRFIPLTNEGDTWFVEVIHESENLKLYKEYSIKVYEGSYNPMLSRYRDIYKLRETYLIDKGNGLEEINLNKKHLLRLFANKDAVEEYARQQNLSFKDEFDVQRILAHFMSS